MFFVIKYCKIVSLKIFFGILHTRKITIISWPGSASSNWVQVLSQLGPNMVLVKSQWCLNWVLVVSHPSPGKVWATTWLVPTMSQQLPDQSLVSVDLVWIEYWQGLSRVLAKSRLGSSGVATELWRVSAWSHRVLVWPWSGVDEVMVGS